LPSPLFLSDIILEHGLCVVDCSWAALDDVPFHKLKFAHGRILPPMLASNPINYGKPFKLNCAEAFSAAMHVAGMPIEGEAVLNVFKVRLRWISFGLFFFWGGGGCILQIN
jgi:pre-rRNA-processing protein TSR3